MLNITVLINRIMGGKYKDDEQCGQSFFGYGYNDCAVMMRI